jgi:biopolymer transport protein ExbB
LLFTVIALSIERYFALKTAFGKGSLVKFVENIKVALSKGDINGAKVICDKQRGSVANVVTSTLDTYKEVENNADLAKDQKQLAIQKSLEEATALELPMMSQNLPIIATITTLGTLFGLCGTVIGMIRSFAALASGGSGDSMALSQGISEALINTAFGIITAALAVISYNYYTNKIDKLTYSLDEVGFSIVQTFAATHEK